MYQGGCQAECIIMLSVLYGSPGTLVVLWQRSWWNSTLVVSGGLPNT